MTALAYSRWQEPDAQRWYIVLVLMAERLRQQGPKAVERDALPWLQTLIAPKIGRVAKPTRHPAR
jgi:hypothetical protein